MHKTIDTDSEIDSLASNAMGKIRRGSRYYLYKHRFLFQRHICILTIAFLTSFIFFLIIFYLNSNHIVHLFSCLTSSRTIKTSLSDNSIENPEQLSIYDQTIKYNDFNYLQSDTLTFENRTYSNHIEILFRFPKKIQPSAVLLIFHGCSISAHDWFHTVERQRIIGAAIDLGYACLAFQATDSFSKCWSSNVDIEDNADVQMIYGGLQEFYKEYPKLETLPRFTFGASSGGTFSSVFAINQRYKIQGQIIFIGIVHPEILQIYVKTKIYSSTVWIYMLRDTEFASEERINASMQVFTKEKISHIGFTIYPISLTRTTFHDRIPTITIEASQYIYYCFKQNQWLDPLNYLVYNPRRTNTWKTFLFTLKKETLEAKRILANINQHKHLFDAFLNTIYGEHEISFEHSYEALKWHKDMYNNQTNSAM